MTYIAAAEPPAFSLVARCILVFEVCDDGGFARLCTADQFALDVWRAFLAGIVDDPDIQSGRRLAETSDGPDSDRPERHAALDRAICFKNLDVETLFEILPDRDGHARTEDEAHGILSVVRLDGFAVDRRRHPSEQVEERAAILA